MKRNKEKFLKEEKGNSSFFKKERIGKGKGKKKKKDCHVFGSQFLFSIMLFNPL